MIWVLGIAGIALALIGLWGGPAPKTKRREAEALARKQPTVSDAWDVLARPLEEELIKIPEHRPWYAPGSDRRFQQGLLVGLGAGLMVATVTASLLPRQAAEAPKVATKEPAATAPATPGATAAKPAPATQTPAPATPAPKPVNISFVIEPDELPPTVADHLKAQGLIADPDQFLARMSELGVDTLMKAGTFVIPTNAPLDTVISVLTAG